MLHGEMKSLQGQFLVAMPMIDDKRFTESVLFVVEHNRDGAMAIAINEKIPRIRFADIYEDLTSSISPDPAGTDKIQGRTPRGMASRPVLKGGPVQTNRGFLLHELGEEAEGISFHVTNNIFLSASMDTLRAIAKMPDPGRAMFALGYCGWQPGQLEDELANNTWLTVPFSDELLFDADFGKRYDFALKLLGINRANLSAFGSRA